MKCDMHIHSRGRDPEELYRTAKSRGMDLVTITEHNDISPSIELVMKHPIDSFTGVEFTTIHKVLRLKFDVLVYRIDSSKFYFLSKLRGDMESFCKYIMNNGINHSLAHFFYSLQRQNALDHKEEIVSMLSTFEAVNGGKIQPGLEEFLKENNKKVTYGSDAHRLRNVGTKWTDL